MKNIFIEKQEWWPIYVISHDVKTGQVSNIQVTDQEFEELSKMQEKVQKQFDKFQNRLNELYNR